MSNLVGKVSELNHYSMNSTTDARAGAQEQTKQWRGRAAIRPKKVKHDKTGLNDPTCKSSGASGRGPTKVAAPPRLPPSSSLPIEMSDMGVGVGAYISPGA